MKHRISVSLDENTLKKLRKGLRSRNFRNKSHLVELAIINFLEGEDAR